MDAKTQFIDSSKQTRSQEKLAIFLAFIAGFLDAAGFLKWKIYVSFISGNSTQLGIAFSSGKSAIIISSLAIIVCFVFGIYAGTCLSLWRESKIESLPFYIVSGILIVYTIASRYYYINSGLSIPIIVFSTGIMNTIVTSVGNQKINTDFVTGTLNSLARNAAMLSMSNNKVSRKQYKLNAIRLFLLWIGFLLGASIVPLALPLLKNWTLAFPSLLLIICALLISNTDFNLKTKSYATEK
ncbi:MULTISPECIES: YoaK family protein [Flavobacterium]|uniref:YoaK family protein n=1 Tax=Flavobacterium TaxID=237 RepID=UPI0025A57CD2|nr:YoaK family protein [Flavobacterium panacagri]